MNPGIWSKEQFDNSVSSKCLRHASADDWERVFAADSEMRGIVEAEESLAPVPQWARRLVEAAMKWPPIWCPHYLFPQPFLEIVDAIGKETPPAFVHGCYTVSRERKERLADYVFCLDAWLSGATADQASAELAFRKRPGPDWPSVCRSLWDVLGERTAVKELLVERMLHRQRWWLKTMTWDDDARDRFCTDQYLGDIRGSGDSYGNSRFCDPYFAELNAPRVARLKERLDAIAPSWKSLWEPAIEHSHLCAPKAFRHMERALWAIGKQRPINLPSSPVPHQEDIPGFLQCEDTYGSDSARRAYAAQFLPALRSVAEGNRPANPVERDLAARLRNITPVKRWLLRLLARRLEAEVQAFQNL